MAKTAIVLAVDFSDCSAHAMDKAIEMAKLLDARIVIVHAFVHIRPAGSSLGSSVPPIELIEAELDLDSAIELTRDWAEKIRAQDIEVDVVAEISKPNKLIIQTAMDQNASMIIIGTHGRGPIKRFFLGSVAQRVTQDADIPVLVVPLALS